MLAFQQGKKDGYSDGVGEGFIAFSYVALLGAYNVWEGEQEEQDSQALRPSGNKPCRCLRHDGAGYRKVSCG